MLASALISKARTHLLDESSALQRWSDADLLDYLNDAQTELINLKPDALTTYFNHTCTDSPRQQAAGVSAVLRAIRNLGGDAITMTQRSYMDRYSPGWPNDTGTDVRHVMLDDADETVFWIWPVAVGVAIELNVTPVPALLTALSDTIEFEQTWVPALTDYVVYRALSSDLDSPGNATVAESWFSKFVQKVGARDQSEARLRGAA